MVVETVVRCHHTTIIKNLKTKQKWHAMENADVSIPRGIVAQG